MIRSTFCHLQGVGGGAEQRLWDAGVLTWEDALHAVRQGSLPVRKPSPEQWNALLEDSAQHLALRDAAWFGARMPANQQWRLLPEFMDSVACVDIETTGLSWPHAHITTIALYDGTSVRTYVHGENLEAFAEDIARYDLLVTFNGKCFDVPFIERSFGISLRCGHVDLRYVFKALGYSGGLKRVEKVLGIDRGELDGVDGFLAVLLWRHYRRTGDRRALETLLAYNVEDVLNLLPLAVWACNRHMESTPLAERYRLQEPPQMENPFAASSEILYTVTQGA